MVASTIRTMMRCSIISAVLAASPVVHAESRAGAFVTIPATFLDSGGNAVAAQRGLFLVPENRLDPKSRLIAIQFVRFAARQAAAQSGSAPRPPVFLLAGGPGSEYDFNSATTMLQVELLRRTRDVIYVSQRGNPAASGLVAGMQVHTQPADATQRSTAAERKQLQRSALQNSIQEWTAKGADLAGYDILNIVDDVHDLRAALGYEQIVLRGCSFGSQWSLSYLKRWPKTVERAMLSGVEPLDYAYDSPAWLWASMERVAKLAQSDAALAPHLPKGGLLRALQTVIERLEKQPVTVPVVTPLGNRTVNVVVDADDVRAVLAGPGLPGESRRERLAQWPRFIIEMAAGDFRYLAARRWEDRVAGESDPLMYPLIDNSIGITAARDKKLSAEPEARWLGDINEFYHNTRDMTPTPLVADDFRNDWQITVPVLLLNGDFDWSTPIENAEHLSHDLAQGRLVSIGGGTHCGEYSEMHQEHPETLVALHEFIDADFEKTAPKAVLARFPARVNYSAVAFKAPTGASLYEQWLQAKLGSVPQ